MAQQVATVWRDLDVENRIRREKIGDRRANFCIWRQNQKAGCILPETELDRATKHAFGVDAAQFALSDLRTVRELCAWKREQNFVADFKVCCTTNDLTLRAIAIVYFANGEPIGIRMTRGRGDLRNDHLVDVSAARLDLLGFYSGASQQIGNVFPFFWKIDKLAEPVNRKLHFVVNVMSSEGETSLDF